MAKSVLVLGAGLVARPLIRNLLERTDHLVTVAEMAPEKAAILVDGHSRGAVLALDATDEAALSKAVSKADLVVSLLPYAFHPTVARACIAYGRDMVTTSYVKEEMRALDDQAKAAGIVILNEVGLDPGIDHMSAMAVIDRVQDAGGSIVSFESMTGALPSPTGRSNPFGYKFSWSPTGVLQASKNAARFLREGNEIDIPGPELFGHYRLVDVHGAGWFEDYPNRDSLPYRSLYGIHDVQTMYRGTLRNVGWCETLAAIAKLGFLDDERSDVCQAETWRTFTAALAGLTTTDLEVKLAKALNCSPHASIMKRLQWLGLFDNAALPEGTTSPLQALSAALFAKLDLPHDETDMVIMQHQFLASYPDRRQERLFSTLIAHGTVGGDTAVARTVGLPAALAARLVLDGAIEAKGVMVPVSRKIYVPILKGLEDEGISLSESVC